jgi:O-antigen ligase
MFIIWILASPFLQGRVISIGASFPDLTFDRVFVVLIIIRLTIQFFQRKIRISWLNIIDIPLILFISWTIISTMLIYPNDISGQLLAIFNQFLLPLSLFWITRGIIKNERQIKQLFVVFSFSLLFLTFPAIFEEITKVTIFGEPSEIVAGVARVRTFTRSAWELGSISAILFSLSLYFLNLPGNILKKKWQIISLVFGAIGIFLTFMRGAWLAVITAILIILIFNKILRRKALPLLFLIIIVFGIVFISVPSDIVDSVISDRLLNQDNITGRVTALEQQIHLFLKNPIIGQGIQSTFRLIDIGSVYTQWNVYARFIISHNFYLSVLVDFGLLSLTLFFPMIMVLIKGFAFYKSGLSNETTTKSLIICLIAAALAYLINVATFEVRLFFVPSALFWVVLGLIINLIKLEENKKVSKPLTYE